MPNQSHMQIIPLQKFLEQREVWRRRVLASAGANTIICDPGDDIVCDSCNGDAVHTHTDCPEIQFVVIRDDYALCQDCLDQK